MRRANIEGKWAHYTIDIQGLSTVSCELSDNGLIAQGEPFYKWSLKKTEKLANWEKVIEKVPFLGDTAIPLKHVAGQSESTFLWESI